VPCRGDECGTRLAAIDTDWSGVKIVWRKENR